MTQPVCLAIKAQPLKLKARVEKVLPDINRNKTRTTPILHCIGLQVLQDRKNNNSLACYTNRNSFYLTIFNLSSSIFNPRSSFKP